MRSREIVQKFCNVARIVTKVLMVLMFVSAGLILFSAVTMLAVASVEQFIEIINSAFADVDMDYSSYQIGMLLIAEAVVAFAEGIVFMYAKRYFENELKDGTPFTHRGADELKSLGIRLLAWPLGAIVVSSVIYAIVGINPDFDISLDIGLGVALIFLSFVLHDGADIKEKAEKPNNSDDKDDFEIHNLFD